MANYKIYSRTEKSKKVSHPVNEDCFFFAEHSFRNDDRTRVLTVADGMGGLAAGEKASADAVYGFHSAWQKELLDLYLKKEAGEAASANQAECLKKAVCEAVKAANRNVCEQADPYIETGTTLSIVVIASGYAIIANVGDSPVYFCRAGEGKLELVSELHTRAEQDVEEGLYARYSDRYYANEHKIYRSLGLKEELTDKDIFIRVIENVGDGDYFLIGSDGAFGRLKETEIQKIFKENKAGAALEKLFERARKDKHDDQTAIFYRVCEEVL